jgi:hypothetical protein
MRKEENERERESEGEREGKETSGESEKLWNDL